MRMHQHHQLGPLHRYQLEVFFLFVFGFFLFVPYLYLIEDVYFLDMSTWQWYFFWPWIIFYTIYSLWTRRQIPRDNQIDPLKRPIIHWILLGITLILFHSEPQPLYNLQTVDIAFGVFTLFLADSYWNFKKIKIFA